MESTARVAIAVAIGFSLLVLLCGGSVEALRPSLSSLPTSTTLTKQSFEEKPPSLAVEEDQKVHESVEIFNLVAAEEQKAVPAEGVHNTNIRVQNIEDPGSLGQKDGNSKQWKTCGVVALFNPAGYSSRLDNFRRFRTASRAQNLWLMVVHLVLSDEHEHGNEDDKDVCMENEIISVPEDADALISLRADSGATLWQKERLINVGIDHLPENCKAVVWPDAELLFTEIDWVEQTLNLVLEGEMVLQPYQYAIRLSQGQLWLDPRRARKSLGKNEGVRTPGFAFAVESSPPSRKSRILDSQKDHGYTGFAWAASRDALREMGGLFDLAVVGGAVSSSFVWKFTTSVRISKHSFAHLLTNRVGVLFRIRICLCSVFDYVYRMHLWLTHSKVTLFTKKTYTGRPQ